VTLKIASADINLIFDIDVSTKTCSDRRQVFGNSLYRFLTDWNIDGKSWNLTWIEPFDDGVMINRFIPLASI
jgi:hypothetical protein